VKEKVLAAYRSGLRNVMLPLANEKDLREVPEAIRGHVKFLFVSSMDEVISELLLPELTAGMADAAPHDGKDDRSSRIEDRGYPGAGDAAREAP
jgi:ATP-dependent Lon protease